MKYLEDIDFLYEIIISKGKGKLTNKAEEYIIRIGNELIKKMIYNEYEDYKDCRNYAIYKMLISYMKFNEQKYSSPFTYFTEIGKRAMATQFNELHIKQMKNSFPLDIQKDIYI